MVEENGRQKRGQALAPSFAAATAVYKLNAA